MGKCETIGRFLPRRREANFATSRDWSRLVCFHACGSRGCDVYGRIFSEQPDRFQIAALCDVRPERLERFGKLYGTRQLFSDEEEFFRERRSDALVIATQDRDHVRMCLRALQLGYTVLLEKPVTPDRAQLKALLAAAERARLCQGKAHP